VAWDRERQETRARDKRQETRDKSTMAFPLATLGLAIVCISLFISSHVVIKTVRNVVDALGREDAGRDGEQFEGGDAETETERARSYSDRIAANNCLLFFCGTLLLVPQNSRESRRSYGDIIKGNRCLLFFLGPFLAALEWCRGVRGHGAADADGESEAGPSVEAQVTRVRRMEERPFPGYTPLPKKLGALMTATLIVLFEVLFSKEVLSSVFGVGSSLLVATQFCTAADSEEKVDDFKGKIIARSNYREAMRQTEMTSVLLDALQNDTTLYGEESYPCMNAPRTKAEFLDDHAFGRSGGTHFFPGQCEAAQAHALRAAREQTCRKEFCNIGRIVNESSIEADTPDARITGLENVHVSKNNIATKIFSFGKSKKPVIKGLDQLGVEVDEPVVEYSFVDESFCGSHVVMCSDYSKYDELEEQLKDYASVQAASVASWAEQRGYETPEVQVPEEETLIAVAQRLYSQLDVAGYVYVAYRCLPLLFPSPLVLFRPNLVVRLRRFLFGAQEALFVVFCLALWWTAEYFRTFDLLGTFVAYSRVFIQDPCVLQRDHARHIGGIFSVACADLVDWRSRWSNEMITIKDILHMVPMMDTCCMRYPYREGNSLHSLMKGIEKNIHGWWDMPENNISDMSMYLPDLDADFAANMTMCSSGAFVRQEIMGLSDAEVGWWQLWINTGFLSSLLLKVAMVNFGLALLRLADPFVLCGGRYVGLPKHCALSDTEAEKLMRSAEYRLCRTAFRLVLFWGVSLVLMVLNIVSTQAGTGDGKDATIAACLIPLAILLIIASLKMSQVIMGGKFGAVLVSPVSKQTEQTN